MKGSEFKQILRDNRITAKEFCERYNKSQTTVVKYTKKLSDETMPKEYEVLLKSLLIEKCGLRIDIEQKENENEKEDEKTNTKQT